MMPAHSLLIGGSKGLGKVVANKLIDQGHHVSILARTEPSVDNERIQNVLYVSADLLNEQAIFSALSEILNKKGKINQLIFLQRYKGQEDRWQRDLEVGLNATRKIIDYLKNSFVNTPSYGSIVLVSSIMGKFANNSQPLSYSISKAGLDLMVTYYAAMLGSYGIRINSVSPITFVKPESQKYYYEENHKLNQLYQKMVPLGRMCHAEDVANVIYFLCSDQSSFINGQNIIIDGGLSAISHESLSKILTEE